MMTEYNVFIHYNIENNVWEEEVSVIKDRVKMLHNVKETLLKWWKNAVTSQVKVYNKKHYLKTYKKEDLVLLLIKNLSQKCLHKKLLHKFAELFCICDIIKKQAYWLSLPICQNLSQDASLLSVIYIDNAHSVWFNNNNINTFNRLWARIASEPHSNLLVCCFILGYKKFYAYSQFLSHCCQYCEF